MIFYFFVMVKMEITDAKETLENLSLSKQQPQTNCGILVSYPFLEDLNPNFVNLEPFLKLHCTPSLQYYSKFPADGKENPGGELGSYP